MASRIETNKLIGLIYSRLTIIEYVGFIKKQHFVVAICICGNIKKYRLSNLKNNTTRSCGCMRDEILVSNVKKHGLYNHPLYYIWSSIKARCYNPENGSFKDYGGRGIKMCDEWESDFNIFYLWCLSNKWEKGDEIDRRNNNGNYSPQNCRLTNRLVQSQNTRKNIYISIDNEIKCFSQWCRELGLNYKITHQKVHREGKTLNEALNIFDKKIIKHEGYIVT